jgi:hypothetical protein
MDLIPGQFRSAYQQRPGLVVCSIVLAAAIGIYIGYRLLGPAIFG